VTEGVYFPRYGKLINYLHTPDSSGVLPIENEIRVDITNIQINQELPKDYFEYKIPQGVHVYDSIADISYTVGEFKGSMDEINRMFDGAHQEASGDTRGTVSPAVSGIDAPELVSEEDKGNSILASSDQTPTKIIILDTSNSGILNRIILFLLITLVVIAMCLVARFFIKRRKS